MHWQIHKDGRADYLATDGRIEVAVALGLDPITAYSASAPLPKHVDEFMIAGFLRGEPVELVKGVTVGIEVPATRRDRARGLHREGRGRRGGPVRRPHRLLHGRRAVPGLPRHGHDDAARRDLSLDRGGQAAAGGRVARQGDRADLPAGRARDRCRRSSTTTCPSPAPSTTAAIVSIRKQFPGHARKVMSRDLGARDAEPHEVRRRRRRGRRRPRLRAGAVLRRRERRPEARRDPLGEGPLDHLDHAPERQFSAASSASTRPRNGRRRARARGRTRSR